MSKLDSAMERFSAALDRLEAGINKRVLQARAAGGDDVALQREIAALREDRSRLADELDRMKAHARELDETANDVSARLDEAIEGIRAVLEP